MAQDAETEEKLLYDGEADIVKSLVFAENEIDLLEPRWRRMALEAGLVYRRVNSLEEIEAIIQAAVNDEHRWPALDGYAMDACKRATPSEVAHFEWGAVT